MSYTTIVPVLDTYHICPSTIKNEHYCGHMACNTSSSIIGSSYDKSWMSIAGEKTKQRININLGTAYIIRNIKYVNYHDSGEDLNEGAQYFQLYGSNSNIMFDGYDRSDNLTSILAGRFERCTFETIPPFVFPNLPIYTPIPKEIAIDNTTPYQYYALKLGNNWEGNSGIGLRRIELQKED